jgi:hypothetical protein
MKDGGMFCENGYVDENVRLVSWFYHTSKQKPSEAHLGMDM